MISQRSAGARALVIISTIVAGLVLLLATAVHAFGGAGAEAMATMEYRVRGGDSLWSIARTVAAEEDPRAVIDAIAELNGLDDSVIHPGDVLLVPADR
jgi:nucleoid-associated protein YgaU